MEEKNRSDKDCEWVLEQLGAYADGELDEAEQARVEEHLVGCENCRRELEDLKRLILLIGDGKVVPEKSISGAVMEEVGRRKAAKLRLGRFSSHIAAIAALFVTVASVTVFGIYGSMQTKLIDREESNSCNPSNDNVNSIIGSQSDPLRSPNEVETDPDVGYTIGIHEGNLPSAVSTDGEITDILGPDDVQTVREYAKDEIERIVGLVVPESERKNVGFAYVGRAADEAASALGAEPDVNGGTYRVYLFGYEKLESVETELEKSGAKLETTDGGTLIALIAID